MISYTPPRPITERDDTNTFSCGDSGLDDWLRRRALPNERGRASRTFVTCPPESPLSVVGYYALAAGSVTSASVPGRVRRNMPDPIPVVILARLAVDIHHQGNGLGSSLLQDALPRVIAAGQQIGIRAMVVHALNTKASDFYASLGFAPALPGTLTYVATIDDLITTLRQ